MKRLFNKIVLITGGSRGIGAAIASHLSAEGASVIISYLGSATEAAQIVNSIREKGGEAIAIKADVRYTKDVDALFEEAIAHFGRVDVLINNAGILINKLIRDTTDKDFDDQFNINVKGVFNTLRKATTHLADNGSIINLSTTVNRLIYPTYGTYTASKCAVEQLSRALSKEIGRGINVNSISPGPTNTELFKKGKSQAAIDNLASMNPFNRISEPEDIARVVAFLASDDAKWINAQNIGINGGMA